ncbi:MAG: hypothetical protein AAGI34_16970 [Pseudomonadota bacterium]
MVTDETGGISILMLVMLVGIALCAGFAMDLMMHETRRASLQGALDRGTLAITSVKADASAEDAQAIIEAYLKGRPFASDPGEVFHNGLSMTEAERSAAEAPWVVVDADLANPIERRVSAATAISMPTTFMRLAGLTDLPVPAASSAIERVRSIEIALLLDISGTMRWRTNPVTGRRESKPPLGESRMERLKPAAKAFVDAVTNNGTAEGVTITLVPYAGSVNLGRVPYAILTGQSDGANSVFGIDNLANDDLSEVTLAQLGVGHRTLLSLVDDDAEYATIIAAKTNARLGRAGSTTVETSEVTIADVTDAGLTLYELDWSDVEASALDLPHALSHPFSFCLETDAGAGADHGDLADFTMVSQANAGYWPPEAQVPHFNIFGYERNRYGRQIMEWGWCPSSESEVLWMTQDHNAVKDAIDGLLMNDGTSTYTAFKWAVASLDPRNQWFVDEMSAAGLIDSTFASTGQDPRPAAADDEATMKIVVLMTDGNVNNDDRPKADFTNYWHDKRPVGGGSKKDRLVSAGRGSSILLDLCEKARTDIDTLKIFTIAFDTNSRKMDQEMEQCAGDERRFFEANVETIRETFDAIATEIQQLKLVR